MKGVFSMHEKFIEFMKENSLSENTYLSYASDIKLFEKLKRTEEKEEEAPKEEYIILLEEIRDLLKKEN